MDTNDKRQPTSSRSDRLDRRMMKINPKKEKGSRLIEFLKNQQLLKKAEEDRKKPTHELPGDCFSYILHRLPIKDLLRSRCVCKLLNDVTKPEHFITCHLNHSEPVLLFSTHSPLPDNFSTATALTHTTKKMKPETFVVEVHAQKDEVLNLFKLQQPIAQNPENFLNYLDISEDGMSFTTTSFNIGYSSRVVGLCKGLILLENKPRKTGLTILNPVTRKLKTYRAGTLVSKGCNDSYGFIFDALRKQYKVVHIFVEPDGLRVSCEILTVEKQRWKMMEPSSLHMWTPSLYGSIDIVPIEAMGYLHWVPHALTYTDACVLMDVEQGKFLKLFLPHKRKRNDGFVKVDDRLCFVCHDEDDETITIWMLTLTRLDEMTWSKRHRISLVSSWSMTPVISSNSGSYMVFRKDKIQQYYEDYGFAGLFELEGEEESGVDEEDDIVEECTPFYIYDFVQGELRRINMKKGLFRLIETANFIPHVNSLLSC